MKKYGLTMEDTNAATNDKDNNQETTEERSLKAAVCQKKMTKKHVITISTIPELESTTNFKEVMSKSKPQIINI